MHILCTTGSLQCDIFRYSVSMHCGPVQLCDMSLSNPLVTPIHGKNTCVNMVNFAEWVHIILKDIVDVKQFLGENLTSFIR